MEEKIDKELTPEQNAVLRKNATEPPFSGKYYKHHEDGMYHCAGCGAQLFRSDAKFDSGSGWPAFDDPINTKNLILEPDFSFGMVRTMIKCKNCGGHLGHLFDNPKTKTGKWYCVNSCALDFKKKEGDDDA